MLSEKRAKRITRHKRVRAKIRGTAEVPRLCVFRSQKHIYAQLINDEKDQTLFSADDKETVKLKKTSGKANSLKGKTLLAYEVGRIVAKEAEAKKIGKVVFDRAGYKYHGRVKALAQGARDGGLKF